MAVTLLIPKTYTVRQRLAASEAPGRPGTRPAGGWIADKTSLRKVVSLCSFCLHRFNPRTYGYELWRRFSPYVVAKCDDCKRVDPRCKMFIHESTHRDAGDWTLHQSPHSRWARKGRWARA